MIQLNVIGRDAMRAAGGVHSVTDVTGFGLVGHASEMAEGSNVTIELQADALPKIVGAETLAIPRFHNRASKSNREFLEGRLTISPNADPVGLEFAFDPQTSGGLLIAIDPDRVNALVAGLRERGAMAAAIIGSVVERSGPIAVALV